MKLDFFEKKILKNQDVIVGGKETEPEGNGSGEETSISECTSYYTGDYHRRGDTEDFGDWISTCKTASHSTTQKN